MERVTCARRLGFKTSASRRNLLTMPRLMNDFRPEEDEIVRERGNECSAIGVRPENKSGQQKSGKNPRQPFDLNRQNKKDIDDFVWIKVSEGEKQRRDQHAVGKIATEKERGEGCADHSKDEIQCKPERTPGAFKTFADKPEKPERQHN